VLIFDIYRGQGVEAGKKSVALGLFWQDETDTLIDARVDEAVTGILTSLAEQFDAHLRD
jgi:phenylalanyl-tRNA synthetase beta chain